VPGAFGYAMDSLDDGSASEGPKACELIKLGQFLRTTHLLEGPDPSPDS